MKISRFYKAGKLPSKSCHYIILLMYETLSTAVIALAINFFMLYEYRINFHLI